MAVRRSICIVPSRISFPDWPPLSEWPKEFIKALPGSEPVDQLGNVTVGRGMNQSMEDPLLREVAATIIRAYIETYSQTDYVHIALMNRWGSTRIVDLRFSIQLTLQARIAMLGRYGNTLFQIRSLAWQRSSFLARSANSPIRSFRPCSNGRRTSQMSWSRSGQERYSTGSDDRSRPTSPKPLDPIGGYIQVDTAAVNRHRSVGRGTETQASRRRTLSATLEIHIDIPGNRQ